MGLFTYMGVTESDIGSPPFGGQVTNSFIAICYDGAPPGTNVTLAASGSSFPSSSPQSSLNNSGYGIAWTTFINSVDPASAEVWGPGTTTFTVGSESLAVTWHTAPAVGVATYPVYPAPTIVTADWSAVHPQPYLSWLPVTPNDPHFSVVYGVSRAFDPAGPWTDALGLAGFSGYPYTDFTDSIGGTAGYVYYRVTAYDAIIGPGATRDVTIYRPPPVITPPPPPPTPAVATGPLQSGIRRHAHQR